MAMPRSDGDRSLTTRSPMETWPVVASSSPAMVRNRVDLPQPDGPTKTTNSPSAISRSTPFSTSTAPNAFFTSTRRTFAMLLS